MSCSCGEERICDICGECIQCRQHPDCDSDFDADELGLDPEEEYDA